MLGFVIGTACLIGLIKVIRGRRYAYGGYRGGCGYGGGCGGGGWRRHHHHFAHHAHQHGPWGGPWGGGRAPFEPPFERPSDDVGGPILLRGLFERLQTTPGQERVIVAALKDLRGAFKKAAEEQAKSARQLAEAMKGAELKTENMAEAFAHVDSATEAIRDATFEALARIHEALDERQRKILADLIGRGGRALENLADQVG
jgi:hypothetical protein